MTSLHACSPIVCSIPYCVTSLLRILSFCFPYRFSGAHAHNCIHDFLQSVAKRYEESGRAKDFVLDLLALRVFKLFAIESEEDKAVQESFKASLLAFIRRNALKHALLSDMTVIMVTR